MAGFHNSSFNPQTLVVLETAFDEAWLTLKSIGNTTIKPDELARWCLAARYGRRTRPCTTARRRAQRLDTGNRLARDSSGAKVKNHKAPAVRRETEIDARCGRRTILCARTIAAALVPLSFLLLAAASTDAKSREERLIPPLPIPYGARTAAAVHPRVAAFSPPLPRSRPAPTLPADAVPGSASVRTNRALVPIND